MSRWAASVVVLGCLSSPATTAATSLPCYLANAAWTSQRDKGDLKAAARSFALLARDCQPDLRDIAGETTRSFLEQLRGTDLRESRGEVLEALFAAEYQHPGGGEPESWWVELIGQRLARKDIDGAKAVLARIQGYEALVSMVIDRRFDALAKAAPAGFDLQAATRRQISRLQARVDAHPKSLWLRVALAWRLIEVGSHGEGLAIIDSALAAGEHQFDDWKDQYPWIMTARGFALYGAGQSPQALKLFEEADALAHGRSDHESFVGNLALMQVRVGKADDALATLRRFGMSSPYAELMTSSIYQRAYVLQGDTSRAEQALLRMREFQAEKPAVYLEGLLRAGHMAAAKEDLLSRLKDPDTRSGALMFAQTFRNPQLTSEQRPVALSKQRLLAMPDVRQAILEVGRIESFDFPEP